MLVSITAVSAAPQGPVSNRSTALPRKTRLVTLMAPLLAAGLITPVLAQQATSTPQQVEEVVISASRIERAGFTAPTPTTVVGLEQIEQRAATSVAEALLELPAFKAGGTPQSVGTNATRGASTPSDLRGVGPARTLTLVDGQRFVPSGAGGTVDLNLIPSLMLDRAEVVTGGASAAWGSDAIAGVVNLILRKRMDGIRGDIQYGESEQGDGKEERVGLAGGTDFLNGKGHIVAGVDYVNNHGILDQRDRDWGQHFTALFNNASTAASAVAPAFTATAGLPTSLLRDYVYPSNYTTGGLILTPGPLRGIQFGPNGTTSQFQFGTPVNATQMVGGTPTTSPTSYFQVPNKRIGGMVRASYDFTDRLDGYVTLVSQSSEANSITTQLLDTAAAGNNAALTIRNDNAFLPASVRSLMATNNLTSIRVGRNSIDSFGPPIAHVKSETNQFAAGLNGIISDDWTWDAGFTLGRNEQNQSVTGNRINANWTQAYDAVVNPAGAIVCRSSLTSPNNGCVPFNVFGEGSASEAAQNYVRGTSWSKTVTRQRSAEINLRGNPFSVWAGPVSIATGLAYRKDSYSAAVDPLSQANGWVTSNQQAQQGQNSVKEAFIETVVPLLKDLPFAKSLDFNGAVRRTDYNFSGLVFTWKAGLTYQVTDEVRLRATQSKDIRAPNLGELFNAPTSSTSTVLDRFNNSVQVANIPTTTSGNANLKPEKGDTTTAGIVLQPRLIPGFSASVDYWKVDINNAIIAPGGVGISAQNLVDFCFSGNQDACNLITRTNGAITGLRLQGLNLQNLVFQGNDYEVSYSTALSKLNNSLPGNLTLRLVATQAIHVIRRDATSSESAGEVGLATALGVPRWKATASANYTTGPLTVGMQARYMSGGTYRNTFVEGVDIDKNTMPSATYYALNASYDLLNTKDQRIQIYGVINNLTDKDPPINSGLTNPTYYDIVGRAYRIGVRFQY